MEIRLFPSNADLPDPLRWQILSVIRIQWYDVVREGDDRDPLPNAWNPAHVVGTEGDALIGYAGVVWRFVEHDGEAFKTYGLSSVFTFPAFRRQGYGGRIVEHATSHIQGSADGDIALLFTFPGLEPFYRRRGWRAMRSTTFLVGDPRSPRVHESLPMMLFLSPKGERCRSAFANARIYVGEDPW